MITQGNFNFEFRSTFFSFRLKTISSINAIYEKVMQQAKWIGNWSANKRYAVLDALELHLNF